MENLELGKMLRINWESTYPDAPAKVIALGGKQPEKFLNIACTTILKPR